MNCQTFESIVGDLARGVPAEARAREEARTHEEVCARCAARLADERALSAGLRGLSAGAAEASAPARVEAKLLAAFRAQSGAGAGATPAATHRVVPLARPTGRAGRASWSWAKSVAAASVAAAAAVALFVLVAPRRPGPAGVAERQAASPAGAKKETLRATSRPLPVAPPPESREGGGPPEVEGVEVAEAAEVTPRSAQPSRAQPSRAVVRGATPASYRGGARNARGLDDADAEIATDFIPLTQDARAALAEGGQVVRVELPRTALQRFGLPMNVERPGGRVKADLMLGYDGVARAIRFVR